MIYTPHKLVQEKNLQMNLDQSFHLTVCLCFKQSNGIVACIIIPIQNKIWTVSNGSSKKSYRFLMSYPMSKCCKQQQALNGPHTWYHTELQKHWSLSPTLCCLPLSPQSHVFLFQNHDRKMVLDLVQLNWWQVTIGQRNHREERK